MIQRRVPSLQLFLYDTLKLKGFEMVTFLWLIRSMPSLSLGGGPEASQNRSHRRRSTRWRTTDKMQPGSCPKYQDSHFKMW